jgi:formate C-acetyltransferase
MELEPGERIIGKPFLRQPSDDEAARLKKAQAVIETIPPYPGGDPGHFHPNYEKLFRVGIGGILEEIGSRSGSPNATEEQAVFYEACRIAMEGMAVYVTRAAQSCLAMSESDPEHSRSWRDLAGICERIAVHPPQTFREAIQLMFLTEICVWFGEDHGLAGPGRMDQTLRRFYEADLAGGRITRRDAFELISCLYIQMNRILWPGSAVPVMVGGRDGVGNDVTNELTYLCLAARVATRLVYPTVGLAWHESTPSELMDFCVKMLGTGIGDPAFFNDEVISRGLRDHGVSEADSHNYMNSTCVEIKVVGASNIWVTAPYFNCAQALIEEMGRLAASDESAKGGFDALLACVKANLAGKIKAAADRLDQIWRRRGEQACFPLASCLMADCLERGKDFDRGGARYNWVENSFVGLANLVDGLIAVKHLVYEGGGLSLAEFSSILKADYEGHEPLRQRILNTLPKYGNDLDEPDELACQMTDFLIAETESHTVGLHRYVPGFFCWIVHERFGSETGATPDGRKGHWALADGAGAGQGRELKGPTASILSTTKWSHRKALGGLVHNAKFSKSMFAEKRDRNAVRGVIETYLSRGGFEIQINVVGKDDLLDAQEHPEKYPDLLVRVAGYSDYFVHLNRNMQDEVIRRTEFQQV